MTIQNVMNSGREFRSAVHRATGGGDTSSSKGKSVDMKVLEKVQKLLLCIGDPNMAIATARYVAKELPLGKCKNGLFDL